MNLAVPDVAAEEILCVTEEEAKAIEAGDVDKYLSLLSPDVVFMPQNVAIKAGDELRGWMAAFLQAMNIRYHEFTHLETVVRDDVGYHAYTCRWTTTPKSGGAPVSTSFKSVHILRRQPDGSWKIARSIWNTNPAISGT
jgi:ketosteroid isomerase-like protein